MRAELSKVFSRLGALRPKQRFPVDIGGLACFEGRSLFFEEREHFSITPLSQHA